jgi:hypothetical protein
MPTNILRKSGTAIVGAPGQARDAQVSGPRVIRLVAGRVTVRIELLDTATADRIWQQLPLFSTAETWGDCIHFETPVETGRDRTARLNVAKGDVCYWSEDDRVMIAWGPTPISRPDEIRLMRPCNIFGRALDDPSALAVVTPGEKVAMTRSS